MSQFDERLHQWYVHWFASPYYRLLYQYRDEPEAEDFINRACKRLGLAPDDKVLDLGCGWGRHAYWLAQKRYQVLGLDLSLPFILDAKKMESEYLRFEQHDMRNPFPAYDFRAILNIFTSFGHFDTPDEDLKVLSNIYRALMPKGYLLLDYLNAHYVRAHLVPSDEKHIQGVHFQLRRRIEEPYVFKDIEVSEGTRRAQYVERVRLLDLNQFRAYFKATGLVLKATFGDYHFNAYEPNTSSRLLCLVQRPA